MSDKLYANVFRIEKWGADARNGREEVTDISSPGLYRRQRLLPPWQLRCFAVMEDRTVQIKTEEDMWAIAWATRRGKEIRDVLTEDGEYLFHRRTPSAEAAPAPKITIRMSDWGGGKAYLARLDGRSYDTDFARVFFDKQEADIVRPGLYELATAVAPGKGQRFYFAVLEKDGGLVEVELDYDRARKAANALDRGRSIEDIVSMDGKVLTAREAAAARKRRGKIKEDKAGSGHWLDEYIK